MIIVRNVFNLKFGQAKAARAILQEMATHWRANGFPDTELYHDVSGPFYRFVLQSRVESLAKWEENSAKGMADPKVGELYQKFVPLVESGERDIWQVVE